MEDKRNWDINIFHEIQKEEPFIFSDIPDNIKHKRIGIKLFKKVDRELFFPDADSYTWVNSEWKNEWRDAVLEDWDNKCAVCGEEEHLHAHHLNSRQSHPEQARDPDNGVILCEDCHKEYHKQNGGYKEACTEDDFYKWYYGVD